MGMAAPLFYTAEMVRGLPADGNRYETVRGELLVTPAPRVWHEEIVARLGLALRQYLQAEPVGHAFAGRSDISWGPDILVEPMSSWLQSMRCGRWTGGRSRTCCW
jgi:Uma2 family endonuclease